eukprot:TRINITY_DN5211_c1_g1_i2.p1 TRINITY_DN5211_c1_g1~~TRINITY_DN5211_c1_g1_i2.p1  ORF type:complete len:284 (+),score=63.31 TRINITY_DN5211_c1_g1_i2:185-1036(+)
MAPSLGVTQLLNELLAEQESTGKVHETIPENEATTDCTQSQQIESSNNDEMAEDYAQQLNDLCGEMDDCLESLERWKAQRKMDNEAMEKELKSLRREAELFEASEQDCKRTLEEVSKIEDEEEYPCEPIEEHISAPSRKPISASDNDDAASRALASIRMEAQAREDAARIAQLRAEVDHLRQKAAAAEADESEMDFGTSMDINVSGLPDVSGLSEWCAEVDVAALRLLAPDELEEHLLKARHRVGSLETDLDSAKCRVDAELGELEQMLAECDAMRAQIRISA